MKTVTRRLLMTSALVTLGGVILPRIVRAAQKRPDLIVTQLNWSADQGLTWSTQPVVEQSDVLFRAVVKNQGNAAWTSLHPVRVDFLANNELVSWGSKSGGLAAGATATIVASTGPDGDQYWNAVAPGTYTILARADPANLVTESNDSNNTRSASLVVESSQVLPDLIVAAVRWSHDGGQNWGTGSVPDGANVWFEADIKNQGDGATPSGVQMGVDFLVGGVEVAWVEGHTASLAAGETVSLRANGGPDGDHLWNGAKAGQHPLVVTVDDSLRIEERNETNNSLETTITVEGVPQQPSVGTIGAMTGAGNILHNDAANANYKVPDLQTLHCGMARLRSDRANGYYQNDTPSPQNHDADVLLCLQRGVRPFFSFFADGSIPTQYRTHAVWFSIGQAFAARFRPGSAFLQSKGFTDIGAYGYSAINEPDAPISITKTEYANMLRGLGEGVKSADPNAKVFPAGYLGPNRDQDYTCGGFLPAIAGLINNGTLDGFDLHTYHSMTGAKIHDTYNRSHQADMDRCIAAAGIQMRPGLTLISTETNIRNPDLAGQNYASLYPGSGLSNTQVARNWFITSMFDVWGCVRPDGSLSPGGPRFPWQLWMQGSNLWYMASNTTLPIQRTHTGTTFQMLMNLLWDMRITFADPKGTGVFKLKGGGKSAWVFQNVHASWSSLFGDRFTINDIPADATKVDVYDGNGLVRTVTSLSKPSHTFDTPRLTSTMGKSWLFVANAE